MGFHMLWTLLVFDGLFFALMVAAVLMMEASLLYRRKDDSAVVLLIAFVIVTWLFVGNLPTLRWWHLGVYVAGGICWLPCYWYMGLRKNKKALLAAETEWERIKAGYVADPKNAPDVWYPRHPARASLFSNALLWFLAAPINLTSDWISGLIDVLLGIMNRIQKSMAVEVPVPKPEPKPESQAMLAAVADVGVSEKTIPAWVAQKVD
jgi:hypothetical protein